VHVRAPKAEESAPATGARSVLEARGVSFSYGNDVVLQDVSLVLRPGEFVALVGPNGSGKSTFLRVSLGLLPPESGSVWLFGEDPKRLRQRWRVGYVPQRPSVPPDLPATVHEVVSTGRLARTGWWRWPGGDDRVAVEHALASVRLADLRGRRLTELSGGQLQRAFIARAFASEPELLVLDEPVAGVDAESQRLFRESLSHLIAEHGAAVLLVSHELGAVAQDLDRVVVLKRTVVFDGTPQQLAERGVSLGVHPEDLPLWLEALR
jgi:zinc transport system ATP-binding protein